MSGITLVRSLFRIGLLGHNPSSIDRLQVFESPLDVTGDSRHLVIEDWMEGSVLNVIEDDLPGVVPDRTLLDRVGKIFGG